MTTRDFGINISGYINKSFGLGVAVRSNICAFEAAEIPYIVNYVYFDISKEIKDGDYHHENLANDNPYSVNLIQINFDNLDRFINEKDKSYFKNKYNIGYWAWELDDLPDEAKIYFNFLDEIWVPSNYCAESISKSSPLPVIKVMHSIPTYNKPYDRTTFNLPKDAYIFLTMFDYHSTIERKNPIGTIDAYEMAFGKNNPDVLLVVKTSIGNKFPEERKKILSRTSVNTSIILIEEILDDDKLYSLMNVCDSFVSLHRAEGFGLTMAEAMSFGKPVIATAYSANTEFMTINNSFLIKYNLISVGNKYYQSKKQNKWADPDLSDAAEKMKFVFNNPTNAEKIGQIAKLDIEKNLKPEVLGQKIKSRLEIILNDIISSKENDIERKLQLSQFENEILQKKIKALRNLPFVKLKENFKNFKNKISGKNRKYIWE